MKIDRQKLIDLLKVKEIRPSGLARISGISLPALSAILNGYIWMGEKRENAVFAALRSLGVAEDEIIGLLGDKK